MESKMDIFHFWFASCFLPHCEYIASIIIINKTRLMSIFISLNDSQSHTNFSFCVCSFKPYGHFYYCVQNLHVEVKLYGLMFVIKRRKKRIEMKCIKMNKRECYLVVKFTFCIAKRLRNIISFASCLYYGSLLVCIIQFMRIESA